MSEGFIYLNHGKPPYVFVKVLPILNYTKTNKNEEGDIQKENFVQYVINWSKQNPYQVTTEIYIER